MPTTSDIASTLAEGRAEAESLMSDTCTITKAGNGVPAFDEATGEYVAPPRIPVYTGPCRLQVKVDINSNVVETTAGEREWTYLTAQLQLPVDGSELVATDCLVTCVSAPYDADLVGRVFNVAGSYHKSHAVYRRFRVKENAA